MTEILATCPDCGEVRLTPDDVLLRFNADLTRAVDPGTYSFTCPTCREFVQKPADHRVIRLLLSGGVTPRLSSIPAEALENKDGPPLELEDILTLHEALQSDDWMSQL